MNYNYLKESIEAALDDREINLSEDDIDYLTNAILGAEECYGLYSGAECIPNPLSSELEETKIKLKQERNKVFCEKCSGTGRIVDYGPYHGSNSECWKCRGEGKYLP